MRNVLEISRREIKRFSTRFSGGSRPVVAAVLVASLLVSYLVAQSGLTLSRGIYTVGATPDAPPIDDPRFSVTIYNASEGQRHVADGSIDALVTSSWVYGSNSGRGGYAKGALKQYLDQQELQRINDTYPLEKAYPLRITAHKINASSPLPADSIAAIIGPTPSPTPQPWETSPGATPAPTPAPGASATDAAVREQLAALQNGSASSFKAQFVADDELIVPSLRVPPAPLSQVIIAFLYIVPMFFISVFFTSSFMDEKTNRKLNILMSAPVSAFEIILGKMLPYLAFSLLVVVGVTVFLHGDLLLALAIFTPIALFIFAIYLMVALFYRTYKDQTFFSMTAITFVTGYLVFPALFAGVNNVSYISPLTLAVQMYRHEGFGLLAYAFSTVPLYLVFGLALYVGVRIFNEEYLMSYGPLYQKTGDAVYLAISKRHVYLSVFLLSVLVIPAVLVVELIILTLSTYIANLAAMVIVLLFFSALVEEVAKSAGIVALLDFGQVAGWKRVFALSFVSAVGFWLGEKLLLALSLGLMPSSNLLDAMNGATGQATSPVMLVVLLLIPLAAHFVFTSVTCAGTKALGPRYYVVALCGATLIHTLYNAYNLHAMGVF